jgi:DNA-binding protein YbaB
MSDLPKPTPEMMQEFEENMKKMQEDMKKTYSGLADTNLKGTSKDGLISIEMTATYQLVNWDFNELALKGGMPEFKTRLTEAWEDLNSKIQGATQSKTMELLNNMPIPEEMKQVNNGLLPQGLAGPEDKDK